MQQLINKAAITVNYPINVRSLSDRSEMGGLIHLATSLYHKIVKAIPALQNQTSSPSSPSSSASCRNCS